ncbi:MAG: biosynthetic-type acetolactate synthase large subunit [Cytophagales bacterium]|nr:biosynthetic-type acetolactate synthase large subunit [Cytophagales bacterium]
MLKLKLKGARYIIRILELLEFKDIFAYPGGAILPIYDEIPFSKMRHILVRHEQAAAFAAEGYARVTGKPGICLATSGPGATNLVTGIADAWADSIPMIAITGQVRQELIGTDAFQETDTTGICTPITKKTFIIKNIKDAPKILVEAYRISITGRPGPVLIDIPRDVQGADIELDENWEKAIKIPVVAPLDNIDNKEFDKAVELLKKAKKPLIIAGHGVLLSDTWQKLRNFVAAEHIPAVSTILGIGVFESSDPLYFSWLGMHGMKYANDAVQEADLIMALGIRFDDRITFKLDKFAPKAQVIHVDIDKSESGKNVPAKAFIHCDLKVFFEKMPLTISDSNREQRTSWVNYMQALKAKFPLKPADGKKFDMVNALSILQQNIPANAIVTTDVGQHQMWSAQYLQRVQPNHFLTSGGLGAMGFGFPAAIGAQAAHLDKQVWAVTGDGGFQMNIQELITLVQENYPVKILILDNCYLGMVRQWQEQFYAKNYSGVDLFNPNFVKLVEAYHLPAVMVDNNHDFAGAILQAQQHDGPFVIHAKVLKEENVLPMVAPGTSLSDTIYYPENEYLPEVKETKSIVEKTLASINVN